MGAGFQTFGPDGREIIGTENGLPIVFGTHTPTAKTGSLVVTGFGDLQGTPFIFPISRGSEFTATFSITSNGFSWNIDQYNEAYPLPLIMFGVY